MNKLMFDEKDIRMDSFSPSNAIKLVHMPTGITAECDMFPMPSWNKYFAMGALNEKLRNKEVVNE